MTTLEIASRTRQAARRFASNTDGMIAIEYIVTGALIGAGVLAGVTVLNDAVTELYAHAIAALNG